MCSATLRSQNQTSSPKNFFAEIQLGAIYTDPIISSNDSGTLTEASVTLGYNISQRFSAGIGLSTIHFLTATPYIYGKIKFGDISKKNTIPFLSLSAGYTESFEKTDTRVDMITIQPKLGLSFYGKKKKSSLLLYAGALIYQNKVLPSIGIGLGF
ncbi:hypothetical protein SDC9_144525 [bioreactor metagenome]|uniref:Outer membrane protein beta-barrel domain-containing protein n=1 Tax=bioreactor metagenome TaxID=1076179 RepID=A0A645E9P3_9ZZZZ